MAHPPTHRRSNNPSVGPRGAGTTKVLEVDGGEAAAGTVSTSHRCHSTYLPRTQRWVDGFCCHYHHHHISLLFLTCVFLTVPSLYLVCVCVYIGKEKRDIRLAQIRMHAMVQVVLALSEHRSVSTLSFNILLLITPSRNITISTPFQQSPSAFPFQQHLPLSPPPAHCCPLLSLCGICSTRSQRKRPDDRCDSATLSRYVARNPRVHHNNKQPPP